MARDTEITQANEPQINLGDTIMLFWSLAWRCIGNLFFFGAGSYLLIKFVLFMAERQDLWATVKTAAYFPLGLCSFLLALKSALNANGYRKPIEEQN